MLGRRQGKRREAISNLDKALTLVPGLVSALEALVELDAAEGDWRALAGAEDRLLASIEDPKARADRLLAFGGRWAEKAKDLVRAEERLERAQELRPDSVLIALRLLGIYEGLGITILSTPSVLKISFTKILG